MTYSNKAIQLAVDVVYDGHRHRSFIERAGHTWNASQAFDRWMDATMSAVDENDWEEVEVQWKAAWDKYVEGRDLKRDFPGEMRRAAEESRI